LGILEILDAVDSIGVAVLIWRSMVADDERAKLMEQLAENQKWIEGLVGTLLSKTSL
jgi:hypothetical protein